MKKCVAACAAAFALSALSCIPSYADAAYSITVDDFGILTVTGQIPLPDDSVFNTAMQTAGVFCEYPPTVTITVINPGFSLEDADGENREDALNYFAAVTADEDGSFSYSGKIKGDSGTYTLAVSSRYSEESYEKEFYYENTLAKQFNALKNAGDSSDVLEFIEDEAVSLGISLYGYNQIKEAGNVSIITDYLMEAPDFDDVAAIADYFNDAVINAMFLTIEDWTVLDKFITETFADSEYSIYTFFNEKCTDDDLRRAVVSEFLNTEYSGEAAFMQKLAEVTLVQYVLQSEYYKTIEDVTDDDIYEAFGFKEAYINRYEKLDDKNEALKSWYEKTRSVSDADDVVSAFETAVAKEETAEKNSSSKTSGGSSSSGSSSSGSIKTISGTASSTDVNTDENTTVIADGSFVFNDLESVEWAREAILTLAGEGIVNGVSDGVFNPLGSVTREQFITMCTRAFKYSGVGCTADFSDVSEGDWYYSAVAAASSRNIISGLDDGSFGVGQSISRQDMAVILYRLADSASLTLPFTNGIMFNDYDDISEYAAESVNSLSAAGILNGNELKNFEPLGTLTRAEAAKALYEFLKYCQMLS